MKPLTLQDLLSPSEYEQERLRFRRHIIDLKKQRRLSIGEHITLVFENRETLLFQVQEMIRAERIFDPQKIQEELDVYNALIPQQGELSATLFIEITENDRMKELLDSFQDIDQPGVLFIREGTDIAPGEFESGHSKEDKISAVHFVRFKPSPKFSEQLLDQDTQFFLEVNHKNYQAEAIIPFEMRQQWSQDLHNTSTLNN